MQTRVQGMAFSRGGRDRLAAVAADAVGALLHPAERLFDRLQDLGVGLLQFELDVDFVVAAGLVGEVSLPGVQSPMVSCSGLTPPPAARISARFLSSDSL